MISNGLLNWQQANNFRSENDAVYGVYNGVGFAAACEDGGKLFTFMLSGPDSAFDNFEDMLLAEHSRLKEVQVGDVEGYLALFFEENRDEMPEQLMTALLDFVQMNARSCGFNVPRVCVKCGAPANKRAFYDNMVQPMCAECRERYVGSRPQTRPAPKPEAAEPAPRADTLLPEHSRYNPDEDDTYDRYASHNTDDSQREHRDSAPQRNREYDTRTPASVPMSFSPATDNGENGDMVKGVLGAVLGAVAGLVPLYVTVFLDFELVILCALSGVAAVFGYVAFGGLKKKNTALITTIVSAELVSILTFVAVNAVSGMGDGLSFGEALSSSVFSRVVDYINFVIAVISSLLGVAVSLDRLAGYVGFATEPQE